MAVLCRLSYSSTPALHYSSGARGPSGRRSPNSRTAAARGVYRTTGGRVPPAAAFRVSRAIGGSERSGREAATRQQGDDSPRISPGWKARGSAREIEGWGLEVLERAEVGRQGWMVDPFVSNLDRHGRTVHLVSEERDLVRKGMREAVGDGPTSHP